MRRMGMVTGEPGTGTDRLSRNAGLAALLLAAGYVAVVALFAVVGAPPVGARARLEYHAVNVAPWWGIVGLSVATDLLYVPLAIGLVRVLRRTSEAAMVVAAAFMGLFVVLDLAVTWPAYASLISLGQQYAASQAGERALLVAAAGYPSAVLGSVIQSICSILTLSIGILVAGIVMVRARFGRAAGVLGVATGLAGIASVGQTALTGELSPLAILASALTTAWLAVVGWNLLRPVAPGTAPTG